MATLPSGFLTHLIPTIVCTAPHGPRLHLGPQLESDFTQFMDREIPSGLLGIQRPLFGFQVILKKNTVIR